MRGEGRLSYHRKNEDATGSGQQGYAWLGAKAGISI